MAELGEKFYVTTGQSVDFFMINKTCQEMGGTVATPRNEEENAAIMKLVECPALYTPFSTNQVLPSLQNLPECATFFPMWQCLDLPLYSKSLLLNPYTFVLL
ncbi:pulmonary surfactant-associated protein A-like [Gracilinanus agilis]|uniref:pulmonary surfactant-associated protein A-like n=1 Tax=Gracilinanus agilis TaxID=191870 RepID=UPI001CFD7E1A|nr:pulmonary surfactant-associated protein A-like [Gracilinanus agilis]